MKKKEETTDTAGKYDPVIDEKLGMYDTLS